MSSVSFVTNASNLAPLNVEKVAQTEAQSSCASTDNSVPKPTGRYKDSLQISNIQLENPQGVEKPNSGSDADKTVGVQIIAPAAAQKCPMPILIFSNGFTEHSSEYQPLLENIASHGYVVINLDHTSSSGPDDSDPPLSYLQMLTSVQANNIKFVIQQIQSGSLKQNLGGLTHDIVLAGHSMGGASSFLVSENPPHGVRGCIDLDGELDLIGDAAQVGRNMRIPSLLLHADYAKILHPLPENIKEILEGYKEFHENSRRSIVPKPIDGIIHLSFCASSFADHSKVPALGNETMRETAFTAYYAASKGMLEFMKNH